MAVQGFSAHDTTTIGLSEHQPKPTALTEGLTEAELQIWQNGKIETGIWEGSVGDFTAERNGYSEICSILSGRVLIEAEGAEPEQFGPGDIIAMPSGWKGVWRIQEPLRKHYTIIND